MQVERTLSVEEKEKVERKTLRTMVALPLNSDPARPMLHFRSGMTCPSSPIRPRREPCSVSSARRKIDVPVVPRPADRGRAGLTGRPARRPPYEILIRQRAERTKFLAALETAEKQTAVLAGSPSVEDYLCVVRLEHSGSVCSIRSPDGSLRSSRR